MIAINRSWVLAPWADLLYACDGAWWTLEAPPPQHFGGERWTADSATATKLGLNFVPGRHGEGLSLEPPEIHYGGNSGFQALNLAVHFGVQRVALLGFDLGLGPAGERHWHEDHQQGLNNPNDADLQRWSGAFAQAAPQLADLGVVVVNASRRTALTCFDRAGLDEVLTWL